MLLEVDHSSGHTKKKSDGLSVENMNLKWGGKQKHLHNSIMSEESLANGPRPETINILKEAGTILTYKVLKPGDTQHFTFQEDDLPPFYSPTCPKYDVGNTKGYVGQPKGVLQILFERGAYVEGMRGQLSKAAMDKKIRNNLPLNPEQALASRGHILILSPKCHPELAGRGIEYAWGKAKKTFRNEINNGIAKDLHKNISASLTSKVLPLSRCWKFARKSRDYCRCYERIFDESGLLDPKLIESSFKEIEKFQRQFKTHRNIADIERTFLAEEDSDDDIDSEDEVNRSQIDNEDNDVSDDYEDSDVDEYNNENNGEEEIF